MGLVTQQDPIGIAGGLNLYGYANGDPVNFSDPFGLCIEDDETCHEMLALLRGVEGETFAAAAEKVDKYQGQVIKSDFYPFSASTNADRMILNVGASMEGGGMMMSPGAGDIAVRLVHETAHLAEDGSYPGLQHALPGHTSAIRTLELKALDELGVQLPAPIYQDRRRRGAIDGR